ncbi:hypothetical protein D3Z52_17400 [Clostridiaceae bacterium]|nr:hypothetical protein [Clostridiaceae bacterium]
MGAGKTLFGNDGEMRKSHPIGLKNGNKKVTNPLQPHFLGGFAWITGTAVCCSKNTDFIWK